MLGKKLQVIKVQMHKLIDDILNLNRKHHLPEIMAKHIFLQNMAVSFSLSEEEEFNYFSDDQVVEYVTKYQHYCLDLEIYLESAMSGALMKPSESSDIMRFLRSYYAAFYELMSKNEISLSNMNKNSKVCMVGVGSMPLSILYMHRFSGASVVGIDNDLSAIVSTKCFVSHLSRQFSNRYQLDAFSLLNADGDEFDYESFNIIVLSIHIGNKDAVVRKILNTVTDKSRVILLDRQVVGLCQYFYKNNPIFPEKQKLSLVSSVNSGVIMTHAFAVA